MTFQTRIAVILDELRQALAALDNESVERLIAAILKARRIFVAGAGRSGLIMRSFAMRLIHLGFDVSVVGETVTPAMTGVTTSGQIAVLCRGGAWAAGERTIRSWSPARAARSARW